MKKLHFLLTIKLLATLLLVPVPFACTKSGTVHVPLNNPPTGTTDTTNHSRYSFLALGDSYTIGQSVTEQERFPAQTVKRLEQTGKYFDAIKYVATTGWTTIDLAAAIGTQQLSAKYSVVTLLIGVNDQYQGLDADGYRKRFTQLLSTSISFTSDAQHVFVLSIPDYSVTPFASHTGDTTRIRTQIDQFNSINKEISLRSGVNYLDITPSTRLALNDPSLIANDGLHPSGKLYGKWVEILFPVMNDVLK
ncbi:SGNH/GDSL hydrolase family protein [Pinibacter soli]|uniref:SGNH/GDSL hydrolase family protein n=1 Tax=Pinibacter soli TaxID=3044211 RepID=A0ABT6RB36_9BACT|nr:SGNH/GDSL hydrolase family protein [Pinibacter soli]MDI3319760.1 SGNH/GDSL hydrolase family protein [Pinibacter soli]